MGEVRGGNWSGRGRWGGWSKMRCWVMRRRKQVGRSEERKKEEEISFLISKMRKLEIVPHSFYED